MPQATYYELLGCEPAASTDELRRAYLRLARANHPDYFANASPTQRRRAEAEMQRINEAWSVLSDPGSRASYDLAQRRGRPLHARSVDDEWEPYDSTDGPDPRDLLDDTPVAGSRGLPRWLTVAPVLCLFLAVFLLFIGLFLNLRTLFVAALLCGSLAAVMFFVVPLVALSRSQRDGQTSHW